MKSPQIDLKTTHDTRGTIKESRRKVFIEKSFLILPSNSTLSFPIQTIIISLLHNGHRDAQRSTQIIQLGVPVKIYHWKHSRTFVADIIFIIFHVPIIWHVWKKNPRKSLEVSCSVFCLVAH